MVRFKNNVKQKTSNCALESCYNKKKKKIKMIWSNDHFDKHPLCCSVANEHFTKRPKVNSLSYSKMSFEFIDKFLKKSRNGEKEGYSIIMITRPCNILRFFTAIEMMIFR